MTASDAYSSLPAMLDEMPLPSGPVATPGGELWIDDAGPLEVLPHYFGCIDKMWNTFLLCGWSPHDPYKYFDVYSGRFDGRQVTEEGIGRFTSRECKHMLTALYRLEHKVPGAWATAHEEGIFHAIAAQMVFLAGGDRRRGRAGGPGHIKEALL